MPHPAPALSLRQARFLAALLTHDSIAAAAQASGIAATTAHAWLKLKHFEGEYARARKQIVHHALVQVQCRTQDAVGVLLTLLHSDTDSTRVYAAKTILDLALRAITFDDHEQRLAALEDEPHASPARHAS